MKKFIFIILIITFILENIIANNYLLDMNFSKINSIGDKVDDLILISNSRILYSLASEPICFYLINKDTNVIDKIFLEDKLIKLNKDIPKDIKVKTLYDINLINESLISFFIGTSYIKFNGIYKLNLENNDLEFYTSDWLKYKEYKFNINLDEIPDKDKKVISAINKSNIFYAALDENAFENIYDIYRYDLKTKKSELFYKGIDNIKWLSLDDEFLIFSSNNGIMILNSNGNILQCYSNLYYSTAAISPDKSKMVLVGGIYEKDMSSYSTEDKFTGKARILTYGVFEFSINQKAKSELTKYSKSLKQLSEEDRLKEIGKIDPKKKIFIKYRLYLAPSIEKLRLRESQNGKVIRTLIKGEKLEYLENGNAEVIDSKTGNWVKVKTEKGEIGWCFDVYLKEVK